MPAKKTTKTASKTTRKTTKKSTPSKKTTQKMVEQFESIRETEVPKVKVKPVGRPPRMSTKALVAAAYEYMETAGVPNVTEFALQMGYERQYLYERAEIEKEKGKPLLSDTIKKISQLKEVQLEKLAIIGACPAPFAIFALKQLGWTDKVEQKVDVDSENCGVIMLAPVLESNHEPES